MSTPEENKSVIVEKEDPKFTSLTHDVDLQLYSLRSYIQKGFIVSQSDDRAKMSSSELVAQKVLDAYLQLANKFHEQFRNQLREAHQQTEIDNTLADRISDADISRLMQQALDKLTTEWARVYGFIADTVAKKTSETQKILDQLSPLITAALRDVGFSPESFPVIPQFGTTYSLGFFNYTDDFMVLNLPITALKSPWEWTIFWHEIAGQKVRLLKKAQADFQHALRETFIEIKNTFRIQEQQVTNQNEVEDALNSAYGLNEFKDMLPLYLGGVISLIIPFSQWSALSEQQKNSFLLTLTDYVYDDFNDFMVSQDSSLARTRKFIQDLSPERQGFPILMFSFDDLLGEIMDELRLHQKRLVKNKLRNAHKEALAINKIRTDTQKDQVMDELFSAWETALSLEDDLATQKKSLDDEGWSADWLEELFEDSFSTLNFDVNFLPIFDRLLRRHTDGGKELRHPPHHIRLAMAAVLKMLEIDEGILNEDQTLPPKIHELLAKLSSEENETLKKIYPGKLNADSLAVIWLAAKKFRIMHGRIKLPEDGSGKAIQQVKAAIAEAMKTNIVDLNTPEKIEKVVSRVLKLFAKVGPSLLNSSHDVTQASPYISMSHYEDKIDALLKSRTIINKPLPLDFRELLDLSFYDVDFGAESYTNVRSPWKNFPQVTLLGPPTEVDNGTVLYVDSRQKERKTNRQNWNDKAPSAFKL